MRFDAIACAFVVIIVLCVDRTALVGSSIPAITTIGSVKPNFEEWTILSDQLMQLGMIFLHIACLAVVVAVAIPRREVYAEFQAVFATGIR